MAQKNPRWDAILVRARQLASKQGTQKVDSHQLFIALSQTPDQEVQDILKTYFPKIVAKDSDAKKASVLRQDAYAFDNECRALFFQADHYRIQYKQRANQPLLLLLAYARTDNQLRTALNEVVDFERVAQLIKAKYEVK